MANNNGDDPARIGAPGDLPGEAVPVSRTGGGRRGRVLLPAAIAAVVAVGVIAVPVFAASSGLPSVTAQQLLAKVLSPHPQAFSGTVQSTVDLGLPSALVGELPSALSGAAGSGSSSALPWSAPAGRSADGSSPVTAASAAPVTKELGTLLSGTHSFRIAADGPTREALSSADPGPGFAAVRNGGSAWIYDAGSASAVHFTGLGADSPAGQAPAGALDPSQAAAEVLKALGSSTTVSVSGQSKVAGQSVYELSVRPKGSGSTVGEVRIAVDAANGLPLDVRVLPADGSDPILDLGFSTVSFATPAASAFDFAPPSGTKVVQQAVPADSTQRPKAGRPEAGTSGVTVSGSGWETVWTIRPTTQGGHGISGELGAVKELGKPVAGGTLVSTKLVNVLVSDNGTVYAGAVTPSVLEAAATR
ncbi:DUF2092 domain-containing protein [Streptacidiphilus sp. 4-A2]|nr:DUF2092 domain-containing protein [Streptacidiphilus sp. 4-A2]